MDWIWRIIRTAFIWVVGTTIGRAVLVFLNSRGYYPEHWLGALMGSGRRSSDLSHVLQPSYLNWSLAGILGLCFLLVWHFFRVGDRFR
jgi:hypothetical protein